jgi:hypothetical protein
MIDSCSPIEVDAGTQLPRTDGIEEASAVAGVFLPRSEQAADRLFFSCRVTETSSAFACP